MKYKLEKTTTKIKIGTALESHLYLITTENTRKATLFWITKFINTLPSKEDTLIKEITYDQVNMCLQQWWDYYENPNTFNLGRQILLGFIQRAVEINYSSLSIKNSNFVKRKEENNEITRMPYNTEEIKELYKTARESGPRYFLLLLLLIKIAPRASEIAKLKWKDVFNNKGYLFLYRKGGGFDSLPINNELKDTFIEYFSFLNEPPLDTYIFSTYKQEIPDRFMIYREMKELAELSNIDYRGVHVFRHFLSIELDRINFPTSQFLRLMGWKSERMKIHYSENRDDDIIIQAQLKIHNIIQE